jgi:hypothetical protein
MLVSGPSGSVRGCPAMGIPTAILGQNRKQRTSNMSFCGAPKTAVHRHGRVMLVWLVQGAKTVNT